MKRIQCGPSAKPLEITFSCMSSLTYFKPQRLHKPTPWWSFSSGMHFYRTLANFRCSCFYAEKWDHYPPVPYFHWNPCILKTRQLPMQLLFGTTNKRASPSSLTTNLSLFHLHHHFRWLSIHAFQLSMVVNRHRSTCVSTARMPWIAEILISLSISYSQANRQVWRNTTFRQN